MKGWHEVTLGQMCQLRAGMVFKPDEQGARSGALPFIKVSDMNRPENIIAIRGSNNWVEDEFLGRCRARPFVAGTVVFAKIGEALKQNRVRRLVRPTLIDNNMMGATPHNDVVTPEFLYYRLASFDIASTATGTALPYLTVSVLEQQKFTIPPIAEQRRIASILLAYDDLIENNTRRIAILEEMARCIYEEWFVRLRFPGREGVRMVESGLGLVPEGWAYKPLGSLLSHHIGGGWGQEELSDKHSVPAYVIRGTDIPDVRLTSLGRSPLRYHAPSNFRNRKLESWDIVFEVSGGSKDQPVGRAVMVPELLLKRSDAPVICASFCRLVRADRSQILPELLRLHFDRIYENRHIMQYQTQSTGITNFKFTVFTDKEMVLKPSKAMQDLFAEKVRPMLRLSESLGVMNANLRTTRDLLLSKLISGELDVSELPLSEAIAA